MNEKVVWTPEDLNDFDYQRDLGYPGEYPYTRGIYPNMYRGRLWTMRQFAGYGLSEDTNRRFRKLWEEGETGFSTAFDLPTLYGYDSDQAKKIGYGGEVGKGGVAIDTLEDMMMLFDGIPIGEKIRSEHVSVSMTINAPACVLLAMYYAMAKRRTGIELEELRGTTQNDILKEFIAQKETIFPHEESMKVFVDTVEFCLKYMPKWNPVSISGYHIREKGATAVQELAFTIADGIAYVDACMKRGLVIDEFAPHFSFFFDIHDNFFEEIAKLRAARRMWAKIMRERFGAKNPRALMLRTHVQTAGVSLTWQQNKNNIIRVAMQALAGILGGAQSIHTDAYDEQDSLPSEQAALLALRTQQILAYETGVADVVDPMGGSYFIENLTSKIEEEARKYIDRIDKMGGMVAAIQARFPQSEIERSAIEYQAGVESGKIVKVGVNKFVQDEEHKIGFRGNKEAERIQIERVKEFRKRRDKKLTRRSLRELKSAAKRDENIMPYVLDAVESCATEGEIVQVLKDVYGEWIEP